MNRLLVLPLVLVAACSGAVGAGDAISESSLTLPATDAARVLAFVNYPGTDVDVLDHAVGLDARAAANIAAQRNGADGVTPSADDRPFTTIAQLDAVPFVGDSALGKLQAYSEAHPAPAAETVEGVQLAGWQSQAVVWGVNQASLADLDALLDRRAAQGLVATRPFSTVAAMGPVPYVGPSALGHLLAQAPAWWAAMRSLAGTVDCVGSFADAVNPYLPDLLFLSESDRPIDVVSFPGAGTAAPTAASLVALVQPEAGSTTETRDPSDFYVDFEAASSTADPNAGADVQAAIAAQLTDVVYIAIIPPIGGPNQAEVDVYLVGRTACGDLVGLHAISIET